MANPQVENGYVRISNELLEALGRTRINGESRQVLDLIIRKTYGFQKKEDVISLSQFSTATGMNKPAVIRGIYKLMDMNIITKKDNGTYSVQKDYSSWKPLPKKKATFMKQTILKKYCYICGFDRAVERHHIVPRHKKGKNTHDNIIVLCPNCHTLAHKDKLGEDYLMDRKRIIEVDNIHEKDNVIKENDKKPLSKTVHTKDIKDTYTKDTIEHFVKLWEQYPRKLGRKKAERHYKATVKTDKDRSQIERALEIYKLDLARKDTKEEFIQHGGTWFNNWQDWTQGKTETESAEDLDRKRKEADERAMKLLENRK